MHLFPMRLATMRYEPETGETQTWIVKGLKAESGYGGAPWILFGQSGDEIKEFHMGELRDVSVSQWTGTSWPNSVPMLIRPTDEKDMEAAHNIGGPELHYPMPLDVIEALLEPVATMPTLYALSEDDGYVVTMMLSSDVGMYMRYANAWHDVVPDAIDGLNVTEVESAALDMFDQFDRAGQLVNVTSMPKTANESLPRIVPLSDGTPEGDTESLPGTSVVASAETLDVPRVTSAEDLPDAISAAMGDSVLQWYVERRVKALGIEADLPWSE